jgi:hypothetical protein
MDVMFSFVVYTDSHKNKNKDSSIQMSQTNMWKNRISNLFLFSF